METGSKPRSALLYHSGAIGDFITALPAIALWKRRTPGARLQLIAKAPVRELAIDAGVVDKAIDVDSAALVPLFRDRFSPAADSFLSSFDAAIVFADESSPLLANIRSSGIETILAQPPFPAADSGPHAVDYHLKLLADPGRLADSDRIPRIHSSAGAINRSFELLAPGQEPVVLHPGSGSTRKNWPAERFLEVAAVLRVRGVPALRLCGPAESGVDRSSDESSPALVSPPLPVLAAILARCRLFIGNDSGISHLAAAVGCPTVSIFGPSDPAVWGPRGDAVTIVRKSFPCSPCHLRAGSAADCGRECLLDIGIDEVLAAADRHLLNERRRSA